MEKSVRKAIVQAVKKEPFAQALKMELIDLEDGYSVVKMVYDPDKMDNIYSRAHGGAVFGLIDEAFETAGQTEGTIAVALNVNITYIANDGYLFSDGTSAALALAVDTAVVDCTLVRLDSAIWSLAGPVAYMGHK